MGGGGERPSSGPPGGRLLIKLRVAAGWTRSLESSSASLRMLQRWQWRRGFLWDACGMLVGWLWDDCGMLQRFLRLNIEWNKRVVTFLLPWGLAIVWATPPGPAAGSRSFQRVFRPSSTGYRRFPPVPAAFHHPLPPLLLLTHFCNNQSHISTIYRLNNQQSLWRLFNKVPIKKSAKINNQRGAINKKIFFFLKAANLTPSVVRAIWDQR